MKKTMLFLAVTSMFAGAAQAADTDFCGKMTGDWTRASSDGGETFYPEIRTTTTDACEVFAYTHFETALGHLTTFHFLKGKVTTDSHFGPNGLFDGGTASMKVVQAESKLVTKGVHRQSTPQGMIEVPFVMTVSYAAADDTLLFVLAIQAPDGEHVAKATYKRNQ